MNKNFFSLPTHDEEQAIQASGKKMASQAIPAAPNVLKPSPQQPPARLNVTDSYVGGVHHDLHASHNNNDALNQVMALLQSMILSGNMNIPNPILTPRSTTKISNSVTAPSGTNTPNNAGHHHPQSNQSDSHNTVPNVHAPMKMTYEHPAPLTDHVFIGNASDARNKTRLKQLNIQFILNLAPGNIPQFFPTEFIYKDVAVEDDITIFKSFAEIKRYIDNCTNTGMKVLIHDDAGTVKSPAIGIAYLSLTYNWTLHESYTFIKNRYKELKLTPQVFVALGNWELAAMGSSTLHQIVLTKKQQKRGGNNNGLIIEDRSLHGFLSNRQARIMFDDYEEELMALTLDNRVLYDRISLLHNQIAQLKVDLANNHAALSNSLNSSVDITKYVQKTDMMQLLAQCLTQCQIEMEKIAANFEMYINAPDIAATSTDTTNNRTELLQYLVAHKNNAKNSISTIYQSFLPQVSEDAGSGRDFVAPKYAKIATLSLQKLSLVIQQYDDPLEPIVDSNKNKVTSIYHICLLCLTISKFEQISEGMQCTASYCPCSSNAEKSHQQAALIKQLQTNIKSFSTHYFKQIAHADDISNIDINVDIEMTYPMLYLLYTSFPSMFVTHNTSDALVTLDPLLTSHFNTFPQSYAGQCKSLLFLNQQFHTTLCMQHRSIMDNISKMQETSPMNLQLSTLIEYQEQISTFYKSLTQYSAMFDQLINTVLFNLYSQYIYQLFTSYMTLHITTSLFSKQLTVLSNQLKTTQLSSNLASNELQVLFNSLTVDFDEYKTHYNEQLTQQATDEHNQKYRVLAAEFDEYKTHYNEQLTQQATDEDNQKYRALAAEFDAYKIEYNADCITNVRKEGDDKYNVLDKEFTQYKLKYNEEHLAQICKDDEAAAEVSLELAAYKATFNQETNARYQKEIDDLKLQLEKIQTEYELAKKNVEEQKLLEQQRGEDEVARREHKEKLLSRAIQMSSDQEKLTSECIKHVISILQSQKIWLGMQLGITRKIQVRDAYMSSLTDEQLKDELQNNIPDNFIYVLEVTPDSVSARAGVQSQDVIVSFNGLFISTVKQIHTIATDIMPGDKIAIAILRPSGSGYTPMILSMETRSRLLSYDQLAALRKIHRGEVQPNADIMEFVIDLKTICDQEINSGPGFGFPHVSSNLNKNP